MHVSPELIAFLQQSDLFHDLSLEELQTLLPYLTVARYQNGDWILREGEATEHLVIIQSGRAELIKTGEIIGFLTTGDWTGEMAHIEGAVRSASLRALQPVSAIHLALAKLKLIHGQSVVYDKLMSKLTKTISAHLRQTDENLILLLKEKLELTRSHVQVSRTIIYMVILFSIFFNIIGVYNNYSNELRKTFNLLFLPSSIFLFGTGAVRLILKSGYPLSFYGITCNRCIKASWQALLISLPILIVLAWIKWFAITYFFPSEPFFAFDRIGFSTKTMILATLASLIFVPAQELIVRGVLQSSFRNFFQGKKRIFHAILASNILFEVLHVGQNLFLAIASFAFGIFWGYLYEKQKTIVGPIVSHLLIAWWGLNALDLLSLIPPPRI